MGVGSSIVATCDMEGYEMYPEKGTKLKRVVLKRGTLGKIELLYSSGYGVVVYENDKRILVDNLKNKFSLVEKEERKVS